MQIKSLNFINSLIRTVRKSDNGFHIFLSLQSKLSCLKQLCVNKRTQGQRQMIEVNSRDRINMTKLWLELD